MSKKEILNFEKRINKILSLISLQKQVADKVIKERIRLDVKHRITSDGDISKELRSILFKKLYSN